MVHSLRTSHRRLPPLQTGRADFPHPAYPRTLRSKACPPTDVDLADELRRYRGMR